MNRLYRILGGGVVGVSLGLLMLHFTGKHGENIADVRNAHAVVVAKAPIAAKAETVFVHDTIRLRAKIKAFDSSAAAYKNSRDSLDIRDTAQVKVTLAKADTAIAHADTMKIACDTTVRHAGVALFTKKDLDDAVDRENSAIRKLIPGRTEKTVTALKWIAGGIAIDRIISAVFVPQKR